MPIYFRPFTNEMPLNLDSIGNTWDQEPIHRPKGFPLYHWLQTESGCGKIVMNQNELELKKGEGVLISPHIPHSYTRSTEHWNTSFATFNGSLTSDIHKIIGKYPFIFVKSGQGQYYQAWINRIINGCETRQISSTTLSVECYDFFIHFADVYLSEKKCNHPLYHQYVEPVIKEIESHFNEPITVNSLSALVYITPQYLTRLFQRFMGCSVYTYITNHRMNKAKELLVLDSKIEIQQLYYRVGYNDVSQFIAAFKRHTGCTPKEFRRIYGIAVNN